LRVVGEPKTFVAILDAADGQRRAEDLFGPHARPVRHVLQDGRLDEPALVVLGAFGTAAAINNPRAPLYSVLDLGLDLGALRIGMHRTHPAVFLEAVAR